jgi:hypothetical protein
MLLDTPEHIREELNRLRLEVAECDSFYKANKIYGQLLDIMEVCLCPIDPFENYSPADGHSTRTDDGNGGGDDNDDSPAPPPLPPTEPIGLEEHKEPITMSDIEPVEAEYEEVNIDTEKMDAGMAATNPDEVLRVDTSGNPGIGTKPTIRDMIKEGQEKADGHSDADNTDS